ncbi:MAG TPA: nucleoside monophosphate kinase [Candidatus Woesebacteria bacterium]|nr:nucleoside monophosphate kinase [Candidatus Woesebacteria bacterium]
MSLNLFIIGPSGCGKSTQAKLLAEKFNLTHYSMGQLLRNEIEAKSEIGLKAQSYIDQGHWVPDDLVQELLESNLQKINNQDFIVDGFPRMLEQGIAVEKYLASQNQPLDLVIHLDVTFEEIMARRAKMGSEFQDANRSDNTPQAVAARQKSYNDTIDQIKNHFLTTQKMFNVDGNRPIDPIFEDIVNKINSLK